jgi:hypothetical protein
MKALSLWQPWASAIALGHKRIETRHWSTDFRGPLAIHAAKLFTSEQRDFHIAEMRSWRLPRELPFGAIVALARLVDVVPTEQLATHVGDVEALYGNYGPNRFGWLLADIEPLAVPVPFTGRQGLFHVPEEALGFAPLLPAQGQLL